MDVEETYKTLEITIEALEGVQPAMKEFKQLFQNCSDQFDQGENNEAITSFKFILNKLSDFAAFCVSLDEITYALIDEKTHTEFHALCKELDNDLSSLNSELAITNYVEMSEIIRYDLTDLINRFNETFVTIKSQLEDAILLIEV